MIFNIKNSDLKISVKSFGAELSSVKSLKNNTEYLWQADENLWPRHAPNLFPIVGKLKNGSYTYNGKSYKLPQHGFARDNEFTCVEHLADSLVFELSSNGERLKSFPFEFHFFITYKLIGTSLSVTYKIINASKELMYFSVGAHPAFNCPIHPGEKFEDYELYFPQKNKLVINSLNDGLISSNTKTIELENSTLPVSMSLFENDAMVFMNHQIDEVRLQSRVTKKGVTLKSENWPYYGIWTKKQSNKFICLEPWYGIADFENTNQDLIQKTGIIKLETKELFSCDYTMLFN